MYIYKLITFILFLKVGTILGTLISGYLIDYFEDWRAVFYFFGILGILWFLFFVSNANASLFLYFIIFDSFFLDVNVL